MPLSGSVLIVGQSDCVEAGLFKVFSSAGLSVYSSVREELDTRSRPEVERFFARVRPEYVVTASIRSGGIGANQAMPAEFIFDNIQSQTNIIDVAYRTGVKKLLYLAASCVYPKECPQPMKEEYFQTGRMEPTSEPYSMAKSAGIVMCQAYRKQYGFQAIVGVPATVYGPGGEENPRQMHVLSSMAVKFIEAVQTGAPTVTLWGTGEPRREFIFSHDLAEACLFLLEHYHDERMINIGPGQDISIRELADIIKEASGFKGNIAWDASKPDGAMLKLLDTARLIELGWRPKTSLRDGLKLCL